MTAIRLSTVLVPASQGYEISVNDQVTVGTIARYLTQQEAFVDANTLELARPVAPHQRLQDIDLRAGDRLLVFQQPAQMVDLPAPLNPGDKTLTFALGDFEVSSRGKKSLIIGKPDENRQVTPDIDLRSFLSPKALDYISRQCLRLDFDEPRQAWLATKIGVTRLFIDEFELTDQPIVLDGDRWLRFYRASDDPMRPASRPIGTFRIQVREIGNDLDLASVPPGPRRIRLRVGSERDAQTLNASEHLTLDRVVSGLATYNDIRLGPEHRLYLVRLLSPEVALNTLNLSQTADDFLYTARSTYFAQNLLVLHDLHDRKRVYALQGTLEGEEKLIGRRVEAGVMDASLDIDLYDAIRANDTDARALDNIERRQAWIDYRPSENTWWIRLEEHSQVPIFINNTRLGGSAPAPLTSGDVLTFGPAIDNYYTRLEVEITSKPD